MVVLEEDRPRAKTRFKVLVIDDNLDHVHSLVLMLKGSGHEVDYAINGTVALYVAQKFKPDVVVLDLGLPDAHGAEVARQLRRDPDLRAVRIIAVTGRTSPEEHQRALVAGCDRVLVKPVPPWTLESVIAQG